MKQLVNRWLRLSLCALLLTAAACSDDDTDEQSKQPAAPTLTLQGVPESGLHFLYFAPSPQTFTLSTDAPWEITKTAGWFIATPKKGEAGEQITITVTGDRNEGDARTGELTVRANSGNYLHSVYTEKTFSLSAGRLPSGRNHRHGHRRGPDRIPGGRSRTGRPAGQRLLRLDIDRGQRNLGHRSAQERQGRHGNHRHRHTEGQHREQAQRIDAHNHRPGPRIQRQQRRAGYRAFAGGPTCPWTRTPRVIRSSATISRGFPPTG